MSPLGSGPGGPVGPGDERRRDDGDPGTPGSRPGRDAEAVFAAAEEIVEDAAEIAEVVEEELEGVLGTVRRERDEYLDMLRRVQADFENYKKRMVRQQTDHLERAAEQLVTKMLPVLDALDLARAHLGQGSASPEGKALLAASGLLVDTLAKEGLERIDDPGAPFDPTMHEAVDHVEAEAAPGGPGADGPVVDGVLRAGYRWKGRVIRPAMVRVRG
ncbi:MAG TPA: nucleotide exchange factor GrpE [Acidimicrobiales bacterium]|nr:nucleotide exchange factor GrpE [Acidimicrobiales bacterium]